jgi:hypothetical protein
LTEAKYIPGTCNLGPAEIRRRYRIGYLGLALACIVILIIHFFDLPKAYRWLIFPPLYYSFSGFIQARHRFCYLYGLYGVFSITGRKHIQHVDKEFVNKDRMTAYKIIFYTLVSSLLFTVVYYLL